MSPLGRRASLARIPEPWALRRARRPRTIAGLVVTRTLTDISLGAVLCCALIGCGTDEPLTLSGASGAAGSGATGGTGSSAGMGGSAGAGGSAGTGGSAGGTLWTNEDLLDVWGSEPDDVWTVGTN